MKRRTQDEKRERKPFTAPAMSFPGMERDPVSGAFRKTTPSAFKVNRELAEVREENNELKKALTQIVAALTPEQQKLVTAIKLPAEEKKKRGK